MKKFINGAIIFLTGGAATIYCLAKAMRSRIQKGNDEDILLDNDDMKITKVSDRCNGHSVEIAVVQYKQKDNQSE